MRPLVQMSGAKGFNEVFFDDVRVAEEIAGRREEPGMASRDYDADVRAGCGWRRQPLIAVVDELVRLARTGSSATDDRRGRTRACGKGSPSSNVEAEALKYTAPAPLDARLKGLPPGAEGSIMKLCATELDLRIELFSMELLGP